MKRWLQLSLLSAIFVVGGSGVDADAAILINEILADPSASVGDANADGEIHSTQDEFIELVNTGPKSVSLEGWMLSDSVKVRHEFAEDAVIPGLGFLVVFGGGEPADFVNAFIASEGTLSLNNSGDVITLFNASGSVEDVFDYGSEGGHDTSLTRSPDAFGDFIAHTSVNDFTFSPELTINGKDQLMPVKPSRHSVVPEPSSLILVGLAMMGMVSGKIIS